MIQDTAREMRTVDLTSEVFEFLEIVNIEIFRFDIRFLNWLVTNFYWVVGKMFDLSKLHIFQKKNLLLLILRNIGQKIKSN